MSDATSAATPAAKPEKKRLPSQIRFIVGNEGAERFSFYGMRAILVVYMTAVLMMPKAEAKSVYHLFNAFCYLFPLVGGWLADRFLGRYNTIFYLSFFYCAGHAALALFEGHRLGLYGGLFLISLGAGAIKPCVSAFVGDQFNQSNKELVPSVYRLFYFMINFGSFFATLLIPWTRAKYGPTVAFGVPGILMAIATVIFWLGRKQYTYVAATGSDPHSFVKVVWSVLKKQPVRLIMVVSGVLAVASVTLALIVGIVSPAPAQGPPTFGVVFKSILEYFAAANIVIALVTGIIQAVTRHKFLELADKKFPPKAVEGAGAALRVMKVFVFVSVFWTLFDQHSGSWVVQAKEMARVTFEGEAPVGSMSRTIYGALGAGYRGPDGAVVRDADNKIVRPPPEVTRIVWEIEPDQFPALNPLMVMILIPLLSIFLYAPAARRGTPMPPLRRMIIGMFVAAVSFVPVAAIQFFLDAGYEVSIWWQFGPYVIITLAEVFVSITGLEFAYTQAPRQMKSTIMSFWFFTVFLGNIVAAYVEQVDVGEKLSHFIPLSAGVLQFLVFTTLMFVCAALFTVLAKAYRGRDYIGEDDAPKEPAGSEPSPAPALAPEPS